LPALREHPLPDTLPLFPLPGVLLLPRGRLPLNIFEPRYLNMTEDALAVGRLIGMIQPIEPEPAGGPPLTLPGGGTPPTLYDTGCAGRISSFAETEDGRYLITLTGVSRFKLGGEIATTRGYRRALVDWQPFAPDLLPAEEGGLDRPRLAAVLGAYFRHHRIDANWETIERLGDERLVTSLAMSCPFDAREKQALLEAPDLDRRGKLLLALIEMAVHETGEGDTPARH
jgi:Lon protease-like protein